MALNVSIGTDDGWQDNWTTGQLDEKRNRDAWSQLVQPVFTFSQQMLEISYANSWHWKSQ